MAISSKDREILRQLAGQNRTVADSERNLRLKKRWTALNELKHSGPPLILVKPEGAWKEIDAEMTFLCESELARQWELALRRNLYANDVIQDDRAFEPEFCVGWKTQVSDFGISANLEHSDQKGGSYRINPVISDLDHDLDKLHFRDVSLCEDETKAEFEQAQEVFGDILDVRLCGNFWWTCGLTGKAIRLIGLEQLMIYMYDQPEGLKRLMQFLSDDMMNYITYFEKKGVLSYNANADMIGSGSLGCTSELPSNDSPVDKPVTLDQLWGFAESQETVGVSPDMFGEFILPYQMPLMEKFGLNYYGCCEPIEKRWEYLKGIPRLRCLSIAPTADQQQCANLLGRDYVYCRKPNPAPVCVGFNEAAIRADLQETARAAGDLNTAIILKDTNTVEKQPERFARWVEIAREEITK